MVVLEGKWYLYQNDDAVHTEQRLCKVLKVIGDRVNVMVFWVDVGACGYADKEYLTPLPDEVEPILSDSISLRGMYE